MEDNFKKILDASKIKTYFNAIPHILRHSFASHSNAMIDVSVGLGSEVAHICEMSNTGVEIFHEKIPFSKETIASVKTLNDDPCGITLYGGEDFEIVFKIPETSVDNLRREFSDFTIVGRIVEKEEGVCIIKGGEKLPVKKGMIILYRI